MTPEQQQQLITLTTEALARVPPLEPGQQWFDFLTTTRHTLGDELQALPPRVYTDHDRGMQQNLRISITVIDRGIGVIAGSGYHLQTLRLGQLMKEAGYLPAPPTDGRALGEMPWYGGLAETEQRITMLTKRRAEAQAALDEALLSDADRERIAAQREAIGKAKNALPTRKMRGDGSQYDKFPDGRIVEVVEASTS